MSEVSNWEIVTTQEFPPGGNPLSNPFYGYTITDLIMPNGQPAQYHGLRVGDIVHAGVLEEDLTIHLVQQDRPNLRRAGQGTIPRTLELPGGFVKENLGLAGSAAQEAREEVKRDPAMVEYLGVLYTSPGTSDEQDHIFMATLLSPLRGVVEVDATEEDMGIVSMPFGKAYDMMRSGKRPVVSQTLAAMSMIAARL